MINAHYALCFYFVPGVGLMLRYAHCVYLFNAHTLYLLNAYVFT